MLQNKNIILASQSPRRKELLSKLDINFKIAKSIDINEEYPKYLIKSEIPLFLSRLKSEAYINSLKESDILITADTIVWLDNKVLNKPKDKKEAINMLTELSNKSHNVYTGVTLTSITKTISFYSKTEVFFNKISYKEINYYVNKYKPFDKAGAYGIQEWIGYIGISKIKGSYFNVVGLPVQQLYNELKKF